MLIQVFIKRLPNNAENIQNISNLAVGLLILSTPCLSGWSTYLWC